MSTTKAYTVSQLTEAVERALTTAFSAPVAVTGEISSLSRAPSGHIYFTLKDDASSLKCVYFKGYAARNPRYSPKNGDAVKAVGEMAVYRRTGEYQLVVQALDYDSVGLFYQKFEATKKALEADGLFDESRKRPMPPFVGRIALVTSATGAAITDFTRTAQVSGGRFSVELWSVPVQGDAAVQPIVEALVKAGNMAHRYDALVIMRGGGSLDDLAVFNDEAVCRALASVKVPTVSAIGHERDVTICDLVADVRVATPTAAAELLSRPYGTLDKDLSNLARRLMNALDRRILTVSRRYDELIYRLRARSPLVKAANDRQRVSSAVSRLESVMQSRLNAITRRLDAMLHTVSSGSPVHRISETASRIEGLTRRAEAVMRLKMQQETARVTQSARGLSAHRLQRMLIDEKERIHRAEGRLAARAAAASRLWKHRVNGLMETLSAYDPEGVLRRGFAIVERNGEAIGSVRDAHIEDELAIRMKDGYIVSFVTGRKVMEER